MIYRKDVEKVKNNLTPTAHNDIILDLCNYWLARNQEMSIKEIVDLHIYRAMVGAGTGELLPNDSKPIVKQCTQQIISEIVGELEKLQEPLTSESEQSDYENVYAVNRCIETIKKMGEV